METIAKLFRRQRNPQGFEALLAPHIDHLYRLAYRFTGSRADAEDLVQELLLKLYPRRSTLNGIDKLKPWLARGLYHLFVDTVRHNNRDLLHYAVSDDELSGTFSPSLDRSPEEQTDSTHLQQRLAQALGHLNADQRALVELHDMEGYTLDELQTILDAPIGTLKSRLHRARHHLRQAVQLEPFLTKKRVNA